MIILPPMYYLGLSTSSPLRFRYGGAGSATSRPTGSRRRVFWRWRWWTALLSIVCARRAWAYESWAGAATGVGIQFENEAVLPGLLGTAFLHRV